MRLFPRWHTPESVAREIIDGLRDGTVTLDGEERPLDLSEVIELCVARATELSAVLAARGVIVFPDGEPTTATLAEREYLQPGSASYFLGILQRAIALEQEAARLRRAARQSRWLVYFILLPLTVVTDVQSLLWPSTLTTIMAVADTVLLLVLFAITSHRGGALFDAGTKMLAALTDIAAATRTGRLAPARLARRCWPCAGVTAATRTGRPAPA